MNGEMKTDNDEEQRYLHSLKGLRREALMNCTVKREHHRRENRQILPSVINVNSTKKMAQIKIVVTSPDAKRRAQDHFCDALVKNI